MTDDTTPLPQSMAAPASKQPSATASRARLRELSARTMWLTAAAIAAVTSAVVVVLWWAATSGLNGAELVTARLDALKIGLSIGVGSGGVVALYLSWRRQRSAEADLDNRERALAHQQHDAAERRLTELYLKAVEQLGSSQAAVRHGGLYALERVAQGNPEQRQTVVNVICAYLRNPYTPPPDTADPRPLGVRRPLLKSTGRARTPAAPPNGGARDAQLQEREVRITAQRILLHHLQPGQDPDHLRPEFWPDIDIELGGATLIGFGLGNCRVASASFRSTTFTGNAAVFSGAEFGGVVRFDGAKFSGGAGFERTRFGGVAGFGGVEFGGNAKFDGAKFGRGVTFIEAEFGGLTGFGRVEFAGNARFDGAKFGRGVGFGEAEFGGDVTFAGAKFSSGAAFEGTRFGGNAKFDGAKFSGSAEFDRAKFGGGTRFGGVVFGGNARFARATFGRGVAFVGAEFGGDAGFGGVEFGGDVWFGGAKFGGDAGFGGAKFGGDVRFAEAKFGGNVRFSKAVHRGRAFDPAEHGVLTRADEPEPAGSPDPV